MKIEIDGKLVTIQPGLIRVSELRYKTGIESNIQIFLDRKGDIDIPLADDNFLVLQGNEKFITGDSPSDIDDNPTVRNPVYFIINGEQITEPFKQLKVCGATLRGRVKTSDSCKLFADLDGLPDIIVSDEAIIVLQGGEEFFTIPSDAEEDGIIDLEKCAKGGSKPPKRQKGYRVKIDGTKYITQNEKLSGEEILGLAGKVATEWQLTQKFPEGKREIINPSQIVDLSGKGIERFETTPKQIQQGRECIGLTDEDIVYLNSLEKKWEAATNSEIRMLIVYNFDLPDGYNQKISDLMIIIPPNYPVAGLDMFYLAPGVQRMDGQAIPALEQEIHGGREWQRWSRHYPWQVGYGLAHHINTVNLSLIEGVA